MLLPGTNLPVVCEGCPFVLSASCRQRQRSVPKLPPPLRVKTFPAIAEECPLFLRPFRLLPERRTPFRRGCWASFLPGQCPAFQDFQEPAATRHANLESR